MSSNQRRVGERSAHSREIRVIGWHNGPINVMRWTPQGMLLTLGAEGRLREWDPSRALSVDVDLNALRALEARRELTEPHAVTFGTSKPRPALFDLTSDGSHIVWIGPHSGGTFDLEHPSRSEPFPPMLTESWLDPSLDLRALSADTIAVSEGDQIAVWRRADPESLVRFETDKLAYVLLPHPEFGEIGVLTWSGRWFLFDVAKREELASHVRLAPPDCWATFHCGAWSADGEWVVGSGVIEAQPSSEHHVATNPNPAAGTLAIKFSPRTGEVAFRVPLPDASIHALALSATKSIAYVGGVLGVVHALDANTGDVRQTWSLELNPRQLLWTNDNEGRRWQCFRQNLAYLWGPHQLPPQAILCIALAPDERCLAVGTQAGVVYLIDLEGGDVH